MGKMVNIKFYSFIKNLPFIEVLVILGKKYELLKYEFEMIFLELLFKISCYTEIVGFS